MLLGILETNSFILVFPGKSGSKTLVTDVVGPYWHYKRHYLNVHEWVANFNATKLNILVTRNPVERFKSGATSHWIVEELVDFNQFMMHHGYSYMKYIPSLPFKIIQFENLWFDFGIEDKEPFRETCVVEVDEKEQDAWNAIKNNKKEITPECWEKLKLDITHINYPNNKGYDVVKPNFEVTRFE